MKLFPRPRKPLSSRMILSALSLAVVGPAMAQAAISYNVYSVGLYDSMGAYDGTTSTAASHVGTGGIVDDVISYTNSIGGVSGTARRYASSTSTANIGLNAWYYDPISHNSYVIGLTDLAHTSSTGAQSTNVRGMNGSGTVIGTTAQYSGTTSTGTSAWIYTAPTVANPSGTTTAIRLTSSVPDIAYINPLTGAESYSVSSIGGQQTLNASGQVVGTASRYDSFAGAAMGTSLWLYSGGVTTNIGLTSGNYTRSDGFQSSNLYGINDGGQVVGSSANYSTGSNSTNDTWVYDTTQKSPVATVIGLTNPASPATATYISSNVTGTFNNAAVAGTSTTGNFLGVTAWVYNFSSKTTNVAAIVGQMPTNAQSVATYSYANGGTHNTENSSISALNASGQGIGIQYMYLSNATTVGTTNVAAGTYVGQDAIFFNGTSSVAIGLMDAIHTSLSPTPIVTRGTAYYVRDDSASYINSSGQVAGTAYRFNNSTQIGQNAWFYSPNMTTDANGNNAIVIGLVDSTHTNSTNNAQNSTVNALNSRGQVIGASNRYTATGSSAGSDAYLYTAGGTSIQLGLAGLPGDTVHMSSDGITENSTANALNSNGLVAGTSTRYSGSTTNGTDVYVYDSNTGTTYPITLSINTATGFASASVVSLTDTNLLIGSYTKYDSNNNSLGTYAYAFTEATGAFDLGINTTNLSTAGWQQLISTVSADPLGDIIGYGLLASDTTAYSSGTNQAVFALTAAVPEPGSLTLLALGACGLLRRRKY